MNFDVIVIGKGPAGLSASLYTTRGNLKTLILGKQSALIKGKVIENYCCTDAKSGEELIETGIKQAKGFGAQVENEEVADVKQNEENFTVYTDKNVYQGRSVLIATGKNRIKVPIGNIDNFEGKGVHYCAACDGFFYTDAKVGVLGYKDYAIHELMELESITSKLTLYTNGNELEINEDSRKYLRDKEITINIEPIQSVEGQEFLEKVIFKNETEEAIEGLFIAYGSASSIDFARKLGITIENNSIKVDEQQRTNVPGIFAAGDCTGGFAQMSTAVGQGAIAGQQIKSYLQSKS
ncbi:MAG: trxB3 [Clostridia bacterium]|jgi:thioredoxin reductase (NADPH)|nr:trxB3 [Clostridia bacterium]